MKKKLRLGHKRATVALFALVVSATIGLTPSPASAGTICEPSLTGYDHPTWNDGTTSIVNARACLRTLTGKASSLANAKLTTGSGVDEFVIVSEVRTMNGTIRASKLCDVFGSFTSGHECDVDWVHSPGSLICEARTYVTVFFTNGQSKSTNPVVSPQQGCG